MKRHPSLSPPPSPLHSQQSRNNNNYCNDNATNDYKNNNNSHNIITARSITATAKKTMQQQQQQQQIKVGIADVCGLLLDTTATGATPQLIAITDCSQIGTAIMAIIPWQYGLN